MRYPENSLIPIPVFHVYGFINDVSHGRHVDVD